MCSPAICCSTAKLCLLLLKHRHLADDVRDLLEFEESTPIFPRRKRSFCCGARKGRGQVNLEEPGGERSPGGGWQGASRGTTPQTPASLCRVRLATTTPQTGPTAPRACLRRLLSVKPPASYCWVASEVSTATWTSKPIPSPYGALRWPANWLIPHPPRTIRFAALYPDRRHTWERGPRTRPVKVSTLTPYWPLGNQSRRVPDSGDRLRSGSAWSPNTLASGFRTTREPFRRRLRRSAGQKAAP